MDQKTFNISDMVLRVFPALAGGFLGTGVFLLMFLFLQSPASENIENIVFSIFSIIVISFVGGISSNVLASVFLTIADGGKFQNKATSVINVFFLNILIFLATLPFLIISKENALYISGIYFIFSAMISALVLSIDSNGRLSVMESAGVVFSGFFLMLGFIKLFESGGEAMLAILLFIIPFSWLIISLFMGLGELFESLLRR